MHPAFSVLFFTTLSGLGYGVLAWLGLDLLIAPQRAPDLALFQLLLAFSLSSIGLLSSLAHLGHPERAWRALSQWRSSWLSREGVLAVVAALLQLILATLLVADADPSLLRAAGAAVLLIAVATVICTAMIYASLVPVPAWRHPLVVPVYLAFAAVSGGLAAAAITAERLSLPLAVLIGLGALMLVALKRHYWNAVDAQALPEASVALGLPRPARVRSFEAPHTEASYITREMGFALARKHRHRLRRLSEILLLAGPALGLLLGATVSTDPRPALALATALLWLGSLVERWLFFAEARHVVGVYYR